LPHVVLPGLSIHYRMLFPAPSSHDQSLHQQLAPHAKTFNHKYWNQEYLNVQDNYINDIP
jgi:hypothetical protein